METTREKINSLEHQQLELKAVMQKSDEHALKCAKSGLSFKEVYPDDWTSYEAAREKYNENEITLVALYSRLEAEETDMEQQYYSESIQYEEGMELKNGRYYSQNGVTYLCTRDTGIPVYSLLKDLVGKYVQEVE